MNRAKTMIVGSVPVVMIINLSLLNYFFGGGEIRTSSSSSNYAVQTASVQGKTSAKPVDNSGYFKAKRKYSRISFPKPAAHTFAEISSRDQAEAEGNIKNQGVIVK